MARGMMGGNMNYNSMIKQAQKMQADMAKAQEELEESKFESTAGGGAVTVTLKGDYTMESISIDPEILEDADVEMLQDLILTAFNESVEKINAKKEETMGKATGGLRMPF
ncbi:MAG: YbaB/EbfC family nucleoid-associated protein [Clostridia bacterium]|nr:YbaB/EbfC family nucleoid-associated protein [Clostridia bacterium]MDD3094510.1 YbaB/EbfC family nucleoid-associated protein [Clostridia bacterium]MDD4543096.1 YbaB/EbfC family nucleoid-associated protein [Clostridia bacterium]HPJ75513.1 YbaB/EbfC family nucleoid-associated protein [Clostridia bacterium]